MTISGIELARLKARILDLSSIRTFDWIPGDDLEFRQLMNRLPKILNSNISFQDHRIYLQIILNAESLVSRNRPNSSQRIIRDAMRGR